MLKHMGAYTVARLTILRLFKKVGRQRFNENMGN